MCARHNGALALIGLNELSKALQQRRLAGAVSADQRQPVSLADVEVEAAKQPAFALDQSKLS